MKPNLFNKHSIFFTINIAFLISLIVIGISFTVLYEFSTKKEDHIVRKRAVDISRFILREQHRDDRRIDKEFKNYLSQLNYIWIDDPKIKDNFFLNEDLHLLFKIKLRIYSMELYELKHKRFIAIFTPDKFFLIEDKNKFETSQTWLIIIYLLVFFILGLLYLMIVKKLSPLQELQGNIQKLSQEKFDIDCSSDKKDEISQLSNEFHSTVLTLKKIRESRNIFIRNIMHELKTPIAKGKFLSELEHTPKNNEKLKRVFLRLEALIMEFASIEELISTKKELSLKEYLLEDILDESIDLLLVDETNINKAYDPAIKLKIDFKLFSIAIKNLLDNGLKYSSNNTVTVKNEGKQITFENPGNPLVYPLEKYFEPFFKGDNTKSNESFGLGLYIIHHILQAHGLQLQYEHKEGINYFKIL